jgi:hypothetical protein
MNLPTNPESAGPSQRYQPVVFAHVSKDLSESRAVETREDEAFAQRPSPAAHAFLLQQAHRATQPVVPPDFWLPEWLRELVDAKAAPETILAALACRLAEHPHCDTVREAQVVLNELGRDPHVTTLLVSAVTSARLRELAGGR